MRRVTLFIAMSLDGFIADTKGGVDWLAGQDDGVEEDSYAQFIRDIDTVVMGGRTYRQISKELSPESWPYRDLTSYVVTRRRQADREGIVFTAEHPCDLVRRLRLMDGRGIWICGGAQVAQQLAEKDLIDRYHLSVIPTLLGNGIPLFGALPCERKLRLAGTRTYNGITDLIYERR